MCVLFHDDNNWIHAGFRSFAEARKKYIKKVLTNISPCDKVILEANNILNTRRGRNEKN